MDYAQAPLTSPLPAGTSVEGRYKLLKAIGQGGFGITYLGWDKKLERRVAVKECFPVGLCYRDGMQLRPLTPQVEPFYLKALHDQMREAHTLAGLRHERVVQIYDVVAENGGIFCVMEWLEGGSLRERMDEAAKTPIHPEQAENWLHSLLQGLEYLHGNGVFHRDIKPENILFDASGHPVLVDFGAALNKGAPTTTSGPGAFSPTYAAPEQVTGKGDIGAWTDLYALAATWYELLTGVKPEPADKRLMEDDLVPLPSMQLRVPVARPMLDFLQRNLNLQPARRCRRAKEGISWLRHGHAPGRLNRILYRAAFPLALAAAMIAAVPAAHTILFPPASAPEPTPQTPEEKEEAVADASEKLEAKLRRLYGVDALMDELRKADARVQEIRDSVLEDEKKECREYLEEMDTQEYLDDHAFASRAWIIESRFTIIRGCCQDQFNQGLVDDSYRADAMARKLHLGTGELVTLYHPADMEEAAVLPTVAARLDREVNIALQQYRETLYSHRYHYEYQWTNECEKKAMEKWQAMTERDAASRPKEVEALKARIVAAVKQEDYLAERAALHRRFEGTVAAARAKEEELVQHYRERIAQLKSGDEARELETKLGVDANQYKEQYREDVRQLSSDCHQKDHDFIIRLHNLKLTLTPREEALYTEAREAVKKENESCDCSQWTWTDVSFEKVRRLQSEIPRSF